MSITAYEIHPTSDGLDFIAYRVPFGGEPSVIYRGRSESGARLAIRNDRRKPPFRAVKLDDTRYGVARPGHSPVARHFTTQHAAVTEAVYLNNLAKRALGNV